MSFSRIILGDDPKVGILRLAIFVLGAICLSFMYLFVQFKGLNSAEAMDNAQLARNIADGKGYVTDNIRPLSVWLFHQKDAEAKVNLEAHPDTVNPPVYPYLTAFWLKLWGPKYDLPELKGEFEMYDGDLAIAVLSCILFCFGLFALFFWTASMVDAKVAGLVAALAAFNDYFWQWAISGTCWSFLFLLTVAIGWLAYARVRLSGGGAAALLSSAGLGLVIGIGFLTRYSFALWLVPVLLLLLIHGGRCRIRDAAVIAAITAVVAAPWILRNLAVTGTPLGVAGYAFLGGTDLLFPGPTLPNVYQPEMDAWTIKMLARKWMTYARQIWETDLKLLGGNWMICFFIASCFYTFRREDLQKLKWLPVYGLLAFTAFLPPIWLPPMQGVTTQDLFSLLAPFFFIFGAVFFLVLLDRWELRSGFLRNAAMVMFVALNSFGFLYAMLGPRIRPFRYPPYYPPLIAKASEFVKADPVSIGGSQQKMREWMMTDMPWAVAWYGRRPAMGLTYKVAEFLEIHDHEKEFSAVFLTPISSHRDLVETLINGELKEWMPVIVFRSAPANFPLKGGFPMGPDFVVLTDPARLPKEVEKPE